MRIGLIVDGQSEYSALPKILPRLEIDTEHTIIGPVKANIQPKAPTPVIALACKSAARALRLRNIDTAIVLFDREDRHECPGNLAESVRVGLERQIGIAVRIVIKDRTFENWLISDPDALMALPARFQLSRSKLRSVVPNKADTIEAIKFLNECAIRQSYQKVKDSERILERADPLRMGLNSRSFRRLLHCLEHPDYLTQSKHPK